MPSLAFLDTPHELTFFANKVANDAESLRGGIVDVNNGIKTTEDLKAHITQGRNISFNYERLIDESTSYK